MVPSRLRRSAAPIVALSCVAALAVAAASAPADAAGARQQLRGTHPAWTAGAASAGSVAGSQQESAKVWLAPRNGAQLTALAQSVGDPAGAQYRKYLTH